MGNISDNNNMDLKKQLDEKNKLIEELRRRIRISDETIRNNNITINTCNKTISEYKNDIKQKDIELQNLREQIKNNTNSHSNRPSNLVNINDVITVNFILNSDKKNNLSIPCVKNNTFAEVEEKLYKEYPDLRETNNNYTSNGKPILRFKTIEDNKIGLGLPVVLSVPSASK